MHTISKAGKKHGKLLPVSLENSQITEQVVTGERLFLIVSMFWLRTLKQILVLAISVRSSRVFSQGLVIRDCFLARNQIRGTWRIICSARPAVQLD